MESLQSGYTHIWHKYRPVILRLMIDAGAVPQQYAFSDHEFRSVRPKNKTALAFIMYIHRSRSLNNIKTSVLAHALLSILQASKTAIELMEDATYELILDKGFVLHVRRSDVGEVTMPLST